MFDNLEDEKNVNQNKPPENISPVNPGATLPGVLPSEKLQIKGDDSARHPLPDSDKAMSDFEERMRGLYDKGVKRGKRYSIIGIAGSLLILIIMVAVGYYLWSQVKDISSKVESREQTTLELMNATSSTSDLTDLNKTPTVLAEWKTCTVNDDCLETQAGCCSCSNGGEQTAINKSYLANWEGEINAACQPSDCAAIVPSCKAGSVFCENGNCVFKAGECANEGGSAGTLNSPEFCCSGLKLMEGWSGGYDGDCALTPTSTDTKICSNCGNLVCDINNGENKCNCPEDCHAITTNGEETLIGSSSVETSSSESVELDIDSDDDGLLDRDEIRLGTDLNNPDTDSDGFMDGDEVRNGYNPNGTGKL